MTVLLYTCIAAFTGKFNINTRTCGIEFYLPECKINFTHWLGIVNFKLDYQ